jgi:repressor LexA
MAITRRQKDVLDFIASFVGDNGYSPSYEEIAHGLSLASLATVHKHIQALEGKGYLRRGFNQSRSVELSPRYQDEMRRARETQAPASGVPLLGRIAAGSPIEQVAGQEQLQFSDFTANPETYALKVRGESMIEDHICDGDYVLISRSKNVHDGDIVVALVDGVETTLKRFFKEGDTARLQPANAAMEPIRVPLDKLELQGKVLAVLRKY